MGSWGAVAESGLESLHFEESRCIGFSDMANLHTDDRARAGL